MPDVLCGCKIWSLTLRKEHRLRVFEKGPKENILTKEGLSNRRMEEVAQ
jgi:hypothetical protein